jgi:hypothetical protein
MLKFSKTYYGHSPLLCFASLILGTGLGTRAVQKNKEKTFWRPPRSKETKYTHRVEDLVIFSNVLLP